MKRLAGKGTVKVGVHPDTNEVITVSKKNPEYGSIRVDFVGKTLKGGFASETKRSAFVHGKIEDLESYGLTAGQVLEGTIIRKESHNPFYEGQNPKINPTTGKVHLLNGKEVYFQDEYVEDVNLTDMWIDNPMGVSIETPVAVENPLEEQTL